MNDQDTQGYPGQRDDTTGTSARNATAFLVRNMLGQVWTAIPVVVQACTNSGGVAPEGTVDVVPLVNAMDALGFSVPHGIIHGMPYFRLHGANGSAVIIDPFPGEIGLAVFAMRDVSAVKKNRSQSNPGSFRRFDPADGFYIGGFLNSAPMQYAQFLPNGGGINLVTPGEVTITAPGGLTINAQVLINGGLSTTQNITAGSGTGDSVEMQGHIHPDPQGGNTGPPVPGS